jgi:hypothetical protein
VLVAIGGREAACLENRVGDVNLEAVQNRGAATVQGCDLDDYVLTTPGLELEEGRGTLVIAR